MKTKREYFDTALDNLTACLKPIGRPRNDQKNMVKGALNSLIQTENGELCFPSIAQVIEAPNGAGKAAVIVAISLTYAMNGKRVLILEPNKFLINDITKYFQNIKLKEQHDFLNLIPYSEFETECVRLPDSKPSSYNCRKWKEKCQDLDCLVKKHFESAEKINIVLATHHKMIYDRTLLKEEIIGKFDLIIIDEFHMIPEVVASYVEKTYSVDYITNKIKMITDKNLSDIKYLIEDYDEIDDPSFKKDIIDQLYKKIKTLNIEKEILDIYSFNTKVSTSSRGITIHREIKEIFLDDIQFLLFSATVIDCREVIYDLLNIDGVKIQSTQRYYDDSRERLQRITILSAVDLPRLGKANMDEFNRNIEVTLQYLTELLYKLEETKALDKYNILILCNSLTDANRLRTHIVNTSLKDRLLDVDEIEQKWELKLGDIEDDSIATHVGNEIAKILKNKNKIILVTGSSVFWQGINLDNVQFLFVLTLPYRKPTVKELKSKRRGWAGYYASASQFKYMVRRLSQGIGRLCRKDYYDENRRIKNWGIAVILDGRLDSIKKGVINHFPEVYRTQFNFYTRDQLKHGLIKTINWIMQHDSPYSKDGQLKLTEFFG